MVLPAFCSCLQNGVRQIQRLGVLFAKSIDLPVDDSLGSVRGQTLVRPLHNELGTLTFDLSLSLRISNITR